MENATGWTKDRLLLSTDLTLSDEEIILAYSRRWPTEPMSHDLKYTEGFREMWMQTRKVLMHGLHIVQTSAALAVMLSAKPEADLQALARIGGWRKQTVPTTPGRVKAALAGAFVHFAPLPLLHAKARSASKSGGPSTPRPPPAQQAA